MSDGQVIELEATAVQFFSAHDESGFFEWLKKLTCVKRSEGRGRTIYLSVELASVDEDALRELLALFRRYAVDMRQLAKLDRDEFADWFRDPNAYWFKQVFG
jgi:hypothetical protein